MAGQVEDQTANGLHVLGIFAGIEIGTDQAAHVAQFGAGVGDIGVGPNLADQGGGQLVMLVLDLADHHFEQVLDGHQPVGAAIFVDHDGHVHARGAHGLQQVPHRHEGGHEHGVAQDVEPGELLAQDGRHQLYRHFLGGVGHLLGDLAQRVLDVDEADDVVEIVVIDRQARMAHLAEFGDQRAQIDIDIDGLDVAALHHDVVDRHVGELEHVLQDGALALGEIGSFGAALLVERDLQIVAQGNRAAGEHGAQAVPDRGPPCGHGGGTRRRLGIGGRRGAHTVAIVHRVVPRRRGFLSSNGNFLVPINIGAQPSSA